MCESHSHGSSLSMQERTGPGPMNPFVFQGQLTGEFLDKLNGNVALYFQMGFGFGEAVFMWILRRSSDCTPKSEGQTENVKRHFSFRFSATGTAFSTPNRWKFGK